MLTRSPSLPCVEGCKDFCLPKLTEGQGIFAALSHCSPQPTSERVGPGRWSAPFFPSLLSSSPSQLKEGLGAVAGGRWVLWQGVPREPQSSGTVGLASVHLQACAAHLLCPFSLPSCSALPPLLLQPKHALAMLPWPSTQCLRKHSLRNNLCGLLTQAHSAWGFAFTTNFNNNFSWSSSSHSLILTRSSVPEHQSRNWSGHMPVQKEASFMDGASTKLLLTAGLEWNKGSKKRIRTEICPEQESQHPQNVPGI